MHTAVQCKYGEYLKLRLQQYVLVYINTMKTTFDLNLDSYQAFKHINMETKSSCQLTTSPF